MQYPTPPGPVHTLFAVAWLAVAPAAACAQALPWLFPDRDLVPDLLAGPRDPVNTGQLLQVTDGPTEFGDGFSADVAVAATLPVLCLAGSTNRDALVVAMEGAAFARFTPYTTILELVNTDWFFAVPIVWRRGSHWLRLRYVHTSSHLGDEYARRFGVEGINFSRDGAEVLGRAEPFPAVGLYAGARYDVNVHPEASKRWVARLGGELAPGGFRVPWKPYLAADLQAEADNGWEPRLAVQAGLWLPPAAGGHDLRLAIQALTGPAPMGQFQGRHTTQLGIALLLQP